MCAYNLDILVGIVVYWSFVLYNNENCFFESFFQDENGTKMVNEYVHQWKIGAGSYGKVVSVMPAYILFTYLG